MKTFNQFQEDMSKLPGLGGGGGGTNAITMKSSAKSVGKRIKDVGNLVKRPFRKKEDRLKADPRSKFASVDEGAAWTKKEGQNKSGGLNEKGRKSYEKENPGSDLKAPSKKVGNKRRASFCARMKGMRKRQKPSNNTGDDRLSKSLRAWNC